MNITLLHDVAVSPNFDSRITYEVSVYPHVLKLENGELLCIYRQGSEKHSHDGVLMVQKSSDKGKNWSKPITIYNGMQKNRPESVMTGVMSQLPDGQVVVVFRAVETTKPDVYIFSDEGKKLTSRLCITRSDDLGDNWSDPETIAIPDIDLNLYVGTRPVILPDETFLLPMEATGTGNQQLTLCSQSKDSGRTFMKPVFSTYDPEGAVSYGDAKITLLPGNRLYMLNWTFEKSSEKTLSVHSCVSDDFGKSWSDPEPIGVTCQIMVPLYVNDSTMIAVGNVRDDQPGIRLWCSYDFGQTWDTENVIRMWDAGTGMVEGKPLQKAVSAKDPDTQDENVDGDAKIWNALPGYTFGTPDLALLDDGSVLMSYYAVVDEITHVRACCFRVEK